MQTSQQADRPRGSRRRGVGCEGRKVTNGVSTSGVTANFMFFDRDFLGTPVNLLLSPKESRAYLFPQPLKFVTFAAAPLVLTSFVRNQTSQHADWPRGSRRRGARLRQTLPLKSSERHAEGARPPRRRTYISVILDFSARAGLNVFPYDM